MGNDLRMYCVLSSESLAKMKGIRGKLAAQAGHAYLHAYWDAQKRFPDAAAAYMEGICTKIAVVVESDDAMLALYKAFMPVAGATVVLDSGKTVFGGEPTLTCVGIGPISKNASGELLSLKLLM